MATINYKDPSLLSNTHANGMMSSTDKSTLAAVSSGLSTEINRAIVEENNIKQSIDGYIAQTYVDGYASSIISLISVETNRATIEENNIKQSIDGYVTQVYVDGYADSIKAIIFANAAEFRAVPSMADGTYFTIISPPGEFRYSSSSGAGWVDDGYTILKLTSVNVAANGRAYSTNTSEHAVTFAAARAMVGISGRAKHVHIESHTSFGDGGGGIFDVKPVGSYVDNNGTVIVIGSFALVRRGSETGPVLVEWFGVGINKTSLQNTTYWKSAISYAVTSGIKHIKQTIAGTVLVLCEGATRLDIIGVTNLIIEIDKGSVLQGDVTSNNPGASPVIYITNSSGITICGEGVIRGNRVAMGATLNEMGAGIFVSNATKTIIKDLTIEQTAGDGITIGCALLSGVFAGAATDTIISKVRLNKNGRDGISLTGVDGCIIDKVIARDADLNLPRALINLEPDPGPAVVNKNVKINDFDGYQDGCLGAHPLIHITLGGYGNEDIEINRPVMRGGATGINYTTRTKRLKITGIDFDSGDFVEANGMRSGISSGFDSYYLTISAEDVAIIGGVIRGGWLSLIEQTYTKNLVIDGVTFIVTKADARAYAVTCPGAIIKDCCVRFTGSAGTIATTNNNWMVWADPDVLVSNCRFENETTLQKKLLALTGQEQDCFYKGNWVRNVPDAVPGNFKSPDMTLIPGAWTTRTSPSDKAYTTIGSDHNGVIMAISSSDTFGRSIDGGITWTPITVSSQSYVSVAYGHGVWAVTDAANRVFVSSDRGLLWGTQYASTITTPTSIAFGANKFVIANATGHIAYSADNCVTFVEAPMPSRAAITRVRYIKSLHKFIAICTTGLAIAKTYSSPDGINWTEGTSIADNNWRDVCDVNGSAIAFSLDGYTRAMRTFDGILWEAVTLPVTSAWRWCASGNGWIVAGSTTTSIYSQDGYSWTEVSVPSNDWNCGAFDEFKKRFIAASTNGTGTRICTLEGYANSDSSIVYNTVDDFRLALSMADGTYFKIVSPPGEYRYSTTSGAGWADDGYTILKLNSVNVFFNGRAYSTKTSEHAATFAAARAMVGISGRAKHVHIESHTAFGDGGGGIFDVKPVGSYVDDNGRVIVIGSVALVRRCQPRVVYACEYGINPNDGGSTDYTTVLSAAYAACPDGGELILEGSVLLSSTVTLNRQVTLSGVGRSHLPNIVAATQIIKAATMTTAALRITSPGIVRNLNVFGRTGNTGDGIRIDSGHVTLDHVSVFGCGNDGIRLGADTTNCNTCLLVRCNVGFNGNDGIHNHHATGADSNAHEIIHCFANQNGRHGFYEANWKNSYRDCLSEQNGGWALYIDDNGTLCGGHTVTGGDYHEGSALGAIYEHIRAHRSRIDVPFENKAGQTLPLTDNPYVGVYGFWRSLATSNVVYSSFQAPLGHTIKIELSAFTGFKHGYRLSLSGGYDIVACPGNIGQTLELTSDVNADGVLIWRETSRSFVVQSDNNTTLRTILPRSESRLLLTPGSSLVNAGSSGGVLVLSGAPQQTLGSLIFDGYGDSAYINSRVTTNATFVIRFACSTTGTIAVFGSSMPGISTGATGLGIIRGATYFGLSVYGVGITNSTLAVDSLWHTAVITRTDTTVTLRIDGTIVAGPVACGTLGTACILGASFDTTFANFAACEVSSVLVLPYTADTSTIQACEDWAENMTGIQVGIGIGTYRHLPADLRMGFKSVARIGTPGTLQAAPWCAAFNSDASYIYVTAGTAVSKINVSSGAATSIAIGETPKQIRRSPDGRYLAVSNITSNAVTVIDTVNDSTILQPLFGGETSDLCWGPSGRYLYGVSAARSRAYKYDLTSLTVASVAISDVAYGCALSLDGLYLYISHSNLDLVTVMETTGFTVVKTIAVGDSPVGVAADPTGGIIAVANLGSATVSLIETATHTVTHTLTGVGTQPYFLEYTPQGLLLVGSNNEANVSRVNRSTGAVTKLAAQQYPNGLAISADGLLMCAVGHSSAQLSIFDY